MFLNHPPSAAKRLYASTLELQYSACVSPYKVTFRQVSVIFQKQHKKPELTGFLSESMMN